MTAFSPPDGVKSSRWRLDSLEPGLVVTWPDIDVDGLGRALSLSFAKVLPAGLRAYYESGRLVVGGTTDLAYLLSPAICPSPVRDRIQAAAFTALDNASVGVSERLAEIWPASVIDTAGDLPRPFASCEASVLLMGYKVSTVRILELPEIDLSGLISVDD